MLAGKIAGGYTVGSDHEILDDGLGGVRFFGFQCSELIAVKYGLSLDGLEAQRAVRVPVVAHGLGDLILEAQVLIQAFDGSNRRGHAPGTIQPGGHAVIGKLGLVVHLSPVDIRLLHDTLGVNDHLHDYSQPVLIEIQGGQAG